MILSLPATKIVMTQVAAGMTVTGQSLVDGDNGAHPSSQHSRRGIASFSPAGCNWLEHRGRSHLGSNTPFASRETENKRPPAAVSVKSVTNG
jgi:hypothetical protein